MPDLEDAKLRTTRGHALFEQVAHNLYSLVHVGTMQIDSSPIRRRLPPRLHHVPGGIKIFFLCLLLEVPSLIG